MKRLLKWLPALVAPVVVVGAMAAPAFAGARTAESAKSGTPSASAVLALVAKSGTAHYSGTLRQTSDLGLPDLSSLQTGSGAGSADGTAGILDLLTAPHTAKVYVDGPRKQRVQVLDSLAERDVIRNGHQVWVWDSKKNTALHVTSPTTSAARGDAPTTTPQDLAGRLLSEAKNDTTFRVTKGSVAGRSVFTLTATPKPAGTLVSKAIVSVDTKTGVPLRVELDAHGQATPAASVSFSSIDFRRPAAKNFAFTPPKGAKVTTKRLSTPGANTPNTSTPGTVQQSPDNRRPGSFEGPSVIGSGWTSILAVPAGSSGSAFGGLGELTADQSHLVNQLTQKVSGGRGLQTSVFSLLLTDDGRVYAGAVPLSALESAAR